MPGQGVHILECEVVVLKVWSLESSIGLHGNLLQMQIPRPHPRPTVSETVALALQCLFSQALKVTGVCSRSKVRNMGITSGELIEEC